MLCEQACKITFVHLTAADCFLKILSAIDKAVFTIASTQGAIRKEALCQKGNENESVRKEKESVRKETHSRRHTVFVGYMGILF